MKTNPLRASFSRRGPDHERAVAGVQSWTRIRFALTDDVPVMVSELSCPRPGCLPLQTAVAFWTTEGERRFFKILKALTEVTSDDVQAAALADVTGNDGVGQTCC